MNLGEQLRSHCEQRPRRTAIHLQRAGRPDVAMSYDALWQGAMHYAGAYLERSLAPGEVVVLILQHGTELIHAFWGGILCGLVPSIMPFLTEKLAPEQYQNDLKALISVTRPAAIVTYPEFEAQVRQALTADSTVRVLISTAGVGSHERPPEALAVSAVNADAIALLQHSSGTTGLQKGVALSHKAVLNQLNAYGETLRLTPEDVVVSWLPLYHDMGLIAGFLMPILGGIPVVLSSPFDWVRAPWRQLQAVSSYGGTLSWLPNFAYNFMAQKIRDRELAGLDLSSWRAVINCSEPVRWDSHRLFFQRFEKLGLRWSSLQTCYAMAENVFGVTQSDLDREPAFQDIDGRSFADSAIARPAEPGGPSMRVMSSGRPLANTRVRILDPQGKLVPDGAVGEIALQSDCMLSGYYNRPDVDATAFRDGWYLTGDYGFFSGNELYVAGRKKDMIIVGGKNIYPQDLETLSYEVPGIHPGRSVAFGVFNEDLGTEDVCMVAEAETEERAEQERLANLIREHIAKSSAVTLRDVRVVGPKWIQKTSSGKTARAANREKFLREMNQKTPLT